MVAKWIWTKSICKLFHAGNCSQEYVRAVCNAINHNKRIHLQPYLGGFDPWALKPALKMALDRALGVAIHSMMDKIPTMPAKTSALKKKFAKGDHC
jgi:hypothetical protein